MSKAKNPKRAKEKRDVKSIISNALLNEDPIYLTTMKYKETQPPREIINQKTKKILQKNHEEELVEN